MPGCRGETPAAFRVKGKEGWAERPGKSKRVPVPGLARSPAGLLSCPSWELRLASLRPCQGQSGIRWAVPAKQQRKQGHRTVPKKGGHHRRSPRIPAKVEQEGGSPPTTRKKAAKVEFQKPARISHTWVPRGSLRRQEQKQARPAKGRAEPRWAAGQEMHWQNPPGQPADAGIPGEEMGVPGRGETSPTLHNGIACSGP